MRALDARLGTFVVGIGAVAASVADDAPPVGVDVQGFASHIAQQRAVQALGQLYRQGGGRGDGGDDGHTKPHPLGYHVVTGSPGADQHLVLQGDATE